MTIFVNPDQFDPYKLFGSVLRRSRLGMKTAFDQAFAAYLRAVDLLEEHRLMQAGDQDEIWEFLGINSSDWGDRPRRRTLEDLARLERMYIDAQAEDLQADYQASICILFANDLLQRFARRVLGNARGNCLGFGPQYQGVYLTSLLKVGGDAIRHVSEWDDHFAEVREKTRATSYAELRKHETNPQFLKAIDTIETIDQVFGLTQLGPLRDVVSMRVLIRVDGRLGSDPGPSYDNFEAALTQAAREIATTKGSAALRMLDAQLAS